MRTPLATVFLLTLLLGGTYWYTQVAAICKVPLEYRIGTLDERFDLSHDEARIAVMDAESIWEEATGRNLFSYSEDAHFTINFIYDERQQYSSAEGNLRDRIDASENVNEALSETYEELVNRHESASAAYEVRLAEYQRALNRYNETVDSYNREGGAPEEVYEELESDRDQLDVEAEYLESESDRLNGLVDQINQISERGNDLITRHNENVERYNEYFGEGHEFTQGDYRADDINIYTFNNYEELQVVLTHELGHAISIGHVENEQSVMYYLLGNQTTPLTLSQEDLAAFGETCGEDKGVFSGLRQTLGWLL